MGRIVQYCCCCLIGLATQGIAGRDQLTVRPIDTEHVDSARPGCMLAASLTVLLHAVVCSAFWHVALWTQRVLERTACAIVKAKKKCAAKMCFSQSLPPWRHHLSSNHMQGLSQRPCQGIDMGNDCRFKWTEHTTASATRAVEASATLQIEFATVAASFGLQPLGRPKSHTMSS
jgi:hypothetical protein